MKLVREQLYEAFTDDKSDPISDMGIGGYSYETLKPGAVLKAKKLGIAVTKNKSGQFTSWIYGIQLWPEHLIFVYKVVRYGPNFKDIYFKKYQPSDKDLIPGMRERLKNGDLPWGGISSRMIVSKKKFDYRFTVIENGF